MVYLAITLAAIFISNPPIVNGQTAVPICDPTSKSETWCAGRCDNSFDTTKTPPVQKNKLSQLQYDSCKCDGTPNLTDAQVKNCEACKNGSKSCLENNGIIKNVIQPIVNFLTALVGIVVVGSIMLGGIQYALGGDNAEKVGQAKKRIGNSLFAFLIFILTFAFLQWLIPGGVFS